MVTLFGIKKEMTQVFDEEGRSVPVTIIDLSGNVVSGKVREKVLVGYGKQNKSNKADTNNYKELGFVPQKSMEVASKELDSKNVGDALSVELLKDAKSITVTGTSKGKGFAGVVKRWGFKGGPKTHGQSDKHRSPGSIGSGTTPGRVLKGMRMGGRMGGDIVTVKNLRVMMVDTENNLLIVKGAVPGNRNSIVVVTNE